MKKFVVTLNEQKEKSQVYARLVHQSLSSFMVEDENHPDLIVSVGGDRTVLDSVCKYHAILDQVVFIGLHIGNLGFFTDYPEEDWEIMISDLKENKLVKKEWTMLDVEVKQASQVKHYLALNEARLEQNRHTLVCDVYINKEHLERFRGNGLCICTPAGSTAYNRSLKGSIISSTLPSMQLSEIAGIHHNAYRSLGNSLVVDDKTTITLRPVGQNQAVLGVDRESFELDQLEEINYKVSKTKVVFLTKPGFSMVQRLKRSFIS